MAGKAETPVMVSVPADLLTRACLLLGELPAKHSAQVYVELLACQTVEDSQPSEVK